MSPAVLLTRGIGVTADDNELKVSLKDVREACEAVSAVPMPTGETAEVRNEAVMDVYTLLEQLAMERAAAPK